jgi:hypothetical protein
MKPSERIDQLEKALTDALARLERAEALVEHHRQKAIERGMERTKALRTDDMAFAQRVIWDGALGKEPEHQEPGENWAGASWPVRAADAIERIKSDRDKAVAELAKRST